MPDETRMQRQTQLVQPSGGRLPVNSAQDPFASEPSYYQVPMLQRPVWKWEIATYFFFGGIAAGSFILARIARRLVGEGHGTVARTGTYVAAACVLPCAPLLIIDLGDPKRFHHMLRIWKPSSPMNLGAWVMTAFSATAFITGADEFLRARRLLGPGGGKTSGPMALAADVVGIPLGLLMAGYTGVLLSATATPVWSRNMWLGPLFSASSMSTGAAAITAVNQTSRLLTGRQVPDKSEPAMRKLHTAMQVVETGLLTGYLRSAGKLAEPLTKGKQSSKMAVVAGGMVASAVLRHIPAKGRQRMALQLASALCDLAAGLALRFAFVYAGHQSGDSQRDARYASAKSSK